MQLKMMDMILEEEHFLLSYRIDNCLNNLGVLVIIIGLECISWHVQYWFVWTVDCIKNIVSDLVPDDDFVKIFFEKFPQHPFLTCVMYVRDLMGAMLFNVLKWHVQSSKVVNIDGIWSTGLSICTFPDGPVACITSSIRRNNKLYKHLGRGKNLEGRGFDVMKYGRLVKVD